MSDIAISVHNLVKEYEVYAKPMDLALEILTRRPRHTTFRALDALSFDVMRGEVLGIIGANGAGKSTLLKIVTGVLDATSGTVSIAGRVTAILELGLGFNPEYSGRENIYLSGLLYGMSREEIDQKLASIIEFSGLGEFIERPVKTYSSGMHSRLAFSIATAVDPEILIIDEALAAGDSAFVQKCLRRIRALCSGGRTVLLVSHGTGMLAQLCQRVMWLERGRVRMVGPAIQVVQAYDLAAHQAADSLSWIETVEDALNSAGAPAAGAVPASGDAPTNQASQPQFGVGTDTGRQVFRRGPVLIDSVEMLDSVGEVTNRLTLLEPFKLRIHYHVDGDIPETTLGVAIAVNNKLDLAPVGQFMTQNIRPFETRESYETAPDRKQAHRRGTLVASFDYTPFRKGEYLLSLGLIPNEPATWEFYEYRHLYYVFSVDDAGMDVGAPVWLNPTVRNSPWVEPADDASAAGVPEAPPVVPAPAGDGVPMTLREEIVAICFGEGGYPDAWPRHAECPACGGGPLAPAFSKYGLSHVRCGACGFVCVDPYPPNDILKKLYNGRYYTQVREFFELPMRRESGMGTPFSAPEKLLLNVVKRATKNRKTGRWLDVGGGIGTFVELIQRERPGWNVYLNELNLHSAGVAKSEFNLQVITDDLQTLKADGQVFDVISTVAVLEHITDPLAFMTACMDVLAPGGCLVNVVPHFSPLNAAVSRGASPNAVPPYHVSLFSERAMQALVSRVPGVGQVAIEQHGDAAFHLIEHVDFGDHWDVSIPQEDDPMPRSVTLQAYSDLQSKALNVLSEADAKIGTFFAETDGRLYLVCYVQKEAEACRPEPISA